jgi:hypothetical protein
VFGSGTPRCAALLSVALKATFSALRKVLEYFTSICMHP